MVELTWPWMAHQHRLERCCRAKCETWKRGLVGCLGVQCSCLDVHHQCRCEKGGWSDHCSQLINPQSILTSVHSGGSRILSFRNGFKSRPTPTRFSCWFSVQRGSFPIVKNSHNSQMSKEQSKSPPYGPIWLVYNLNTVFCSWSDKGAFGLFLNHPQSKVVAGHRKNTQSRVNYCPLLSPAAILMLPSPFMRFPVFVNWPSLISLTIGESPQIPFFWIAIILC